MVNDVGTEPVKDASASGQVRRTKIPTFLYIGTSKAGSTWIFKLLSSHPQIYMYPGKNLGFFSSHFDEGYDWYRSKFDPRPQHRAVGEVSHRYFTTPEAPQRIREVLPDAKLLVCLREPVERTYSDYLDAIKNGKLQGSFEEALQRSPGLIGKSRYGTRLALYLKHIPRDQIHIACFDEMAADPDLFAARIFEFLGVDPFDLPPKLKGKVLPAGTPRIRGVAMMAKKMSKMARRLGWVGLRGRLKTSRSIRNALYRPYTDNSRPPIPPATEASLRELMTEEVQRLDRVAGTDFCSRWNYPRP